MENRSTLASTANSLAPANAMLSNTALNSFMRDQ
ncbi:Uncharacterised protein [Vibrio cholerae]|nr:Uncharacterised protein [Vibrio cholerae]